MDISAEFGYMSADVTTAQASGTFTPRQRAIYQLVLATQQAAIDSVRPGMDIPRLNQIARPTCALTPTPCAVRLPATNTSSTG
jgi:Xaa-Pro aminopeptidase